MKFQNVQQNTNPKHSHDTGSHARGPELKLCALSAALDADKEESPSNCGVQTIANYLYTWPRHQLHGGRIKMFSDVEGLRKRLSRVSDL